MKIFQFLSFRRSNTQAQTWETVEPAKAFGSDEMPEASVRSHLVSPVVKGGPKSRLFIMPFGNGFKRGSTYVTDGKAYGVDLLDGMTPEQIEKTIRMVGGEASSADGAAANSKLMVIRTGDDQPDSPVQVEARRRRFAGVFSNIAFIRDALPENSK